MAESSVVLVYKGYECPVSGWALREAEDRLDAVHLAAALGRALGETLVQAHSADAAEVITEAFTRAFHAAAQRGAFDAAQPGAETTIRSPAANRRPL